MSSSQITPTLAKDLSFDDQVGVVGDALKTRAAVQKDIKAKWVAVVQVLSKYDMKAPGRRADAGSAANLVQDLVVYKAKPEIAPEFQQIIAGGYWTYELGSLTAKSGLLRLIDAQVNGFKKFMDGLAEAHAIAQEPVTKDEDKTKQARAELQAAVNEYLLALESYDDTVTSVTNVKEYITIVKDIAEISAIAQGVKARE